MQQIEWIEKRLKLDIQKNNPLWPKFVEFFERRNLVAHTSGKVSGQYLDTCKAHGFDTAGLKPGDELRVTAEYLRQSIDLLLEFGIKLAHVVWRKLLPDQAEIAIQELNQTGYELISSRRYTVAARLLQFGLHETKKQGSELVRKMMVVNYANAEKLSGNADKAKSIIEKKDWSAAGDNFRISVAAVLDDVETVIKLMKSVVESGSVSLGSLRDWPVFETARSNPKFVSHFESSFGEKLFQDTSAPSEELGTGTNQNQDAGLDLDTSTKH